MIRELSLLKIYNCSKQDLLGDDLFILYQISPTELLLHYNTEIIECPDNIRVSIIMDNVISIIYDKDFIKESIVYLVIESKEILNNKYDDVWKSVVNSIEGEIIIKIGNK